MKECHCTAFIHFIAGGPVEVSGGETTKVPEREQCYGGCLNEINDLLSLCSYVRVGLLEIR